MKLRTIALTLTVLTVVLFQLVSPTVAFADGEVPPETTPTEETTPPEEGPTPPVEAGAPLLEQLPPDTTVVVVNEAGEVEPLVTEAAALAIEEGDPVWCPGTYGSGTEVLPGGEGCTEYFARIGDETTGLVKELIDGSYSGDGTIYLAVGNIAQYDRYKEIVIDGYDLEGLAGHDLTLQGAWDFETNNLVEGGFTNFNGTDWASNLTITNWGGNVFVNNIRINNTSPGKLPEVVGTGSGLTVVTDGNVEVNDSRFNGNQYSGVSVDAGGDITLTNVNAEENDERGARLRSGGQVTVNGGQYDSNGMSGLRILNPEEDLKTFEGGGEIAEYGVTLNNVYARWNGIHGANLDGVYGDVTVTGGVFRGNDRHGINIYVYDDGDVHLTDVLAINNGKDGTASGAKIDTGGNIDIADSTFEGNDNGIVAYAGYSTKGGEVSETGGNISLTDVWLVDNRKAGASLESYDGNISLNQVYAGGNKTGVEGWAKSVDVTNSVFGASDLYGLNGNRLMGAMLAGYSYVNVTDSQFSGNGRNGGYAWMFMGPAGLAVFSFGEIQLTNVTANDNVLGEGVESEMPPNGIYAILGTDGSSSANLTLNNVTASGNGGSGLLVMEDWFLKASVSEGQEEPTNSHNIWVGDSTFNSNGSAGMGMLMDNPFCGMTIQDTTANYNDIGLAVHGYYGDILVKDSIFNENIFGGIDLEYVNNVTLYNVEANSNLATEGGGAYINADGDVVIECSRFNANAGNGLFVDYANQVKLLSVTAEGNGGDNIRIDPGILVEIGTSLCGAGGNKDKPVQPVYSLLTCTEPETVATLTSEDGDMVVFNQLCNYEAKLLVKPQKDLPGVLPEGNTFVSGLFVKVLEDGKALDLLPSGKSMLVSFKLPEGATGDFAILWWDGSGWVDLGGEKSADGLYFQVTTDKTGTFILVQK